MQETKVQQFLRSEASFYIALIGGVFTVAAFYFGLTNHLNLLEQKVDYMAADKQQQETRLTAVESQNRDIDKRLTIHEAKDSEYQKINK